MGRPHGEADEDLEGLLPLSRLINRSGTSPVVGSGGASMLYRAYCSCGAKHSQYQRLSRATC